MGLSKEQYLAHYGTRGMRWGVRKSQKTRNAEISKMSDSELVEKIGRASKEQQLKRLTAPTKSQARQVTEGVLRNSGSQVLTSAAVTTASIVVGSKMLNKPITKEAIARRAFGVY